jgi:hypothetical protein
MPGLPQLPVDFPPRQTVYGLFVRWEARGIAERLMVVLRGQVRRDRGREAEPNAGIIDSQSVKDADTVGGDTRGYDTDKKINLRKRFIITDMRMVSEQDGIQAIRQLLRGPTISDGFRALWERGASTSPLKHLYCNRSIASSSLRMTSPKLENASMSLDPYGSPQN